jgi:hypothetical protein
MTHMILTRRFFALAAASAVVTGGALLPTTAFAAAPVAQHTMTADARADHRNPGPWDPGHGDHDGDGYGGRGGNGGVHTKGDDWRKHPVCFAAPCEL